MKKFALALAVSLTATVPAHAEVAAADVQISSILMQKLSSTSYRCNVSVFSNNDDDAQDVNLHVLLPLEMRVTSVSPGCWIGPPMGDASRGIVLCKLGSMGVNETKAVSVSVYALPASVGYQKSCAAFVESSVPDGNHSNNFGQSIAP
jgi:hypothetical protein